MDVQWESMGRHDRMNRNQWAQQADGDVRNVCRQTKSHTLNELILCSMMNSTSKANTEGNVNLVVASGLSFNSINIQIPKNNRNRENH
jgi:hypothetical protein